MSDGKRLCCFDGSVTLDGNGSGWIPFNPNFSNSNDIKAVFGLADTNVFDRVVAYKKEFNGIAFQAYKNNVILSNATIWISCFAIGNA